MTIPANTILNDLASENKEDLILLKTGVIAGYIDFDKNKIYSLFNDNFLWVIILFSRRIHLYFLIKH